MNHFTNGYLCRVYCILQFIVSPRKLHKMAKNIKSKPLAQSFKMTKEDDEDVILLF